MYTVLNPIATKRTARIQTDTNSVRDDSESKPLRRRIQYNLIKPYPVCECKVAKSKTSVKMDSADETLYQTLLNVFKHKSFRSELQETAIKTICKGQPALWFYPPFFRPRKFRTHLFWPFLWMSVSLSRELLYLEFVLNYSGN